VKAARARSASFSISTAHTTVDATAMQINQSRAASGIVENARWRKGEYTTATCSAADASTAAQSQLFANIRWKALRSRNRALNVLQSW
jgi:hypothetical protein